MYPHFAFQKTQSGCRAYLKGPPELLALLPKADSTGFALENRQGDWVVKDNDCRTFSTEEKAAFFYLDTVLVTPAARTLIPARAASDDRPCHWPRMLNRERTEEVYGILEELLGAPKASRSDFIAAVSNKDALVTWEFEGWGGHRFVFEIQSKGIDFRGNPMTASGWSSLLSSLAYMKIRGLYQEETTTTEPLAPKAPVDLPEVVSVAEDIEGGDEFPDMASLFGGR